MLFSVKMQLYSVTKASWKLKKMDGWHGNVRMIMGNEITVSLGYKDINASLVKACIHVNFHAKNKKE